MAKTESKIQAATRTGRAGAGLMTWGHHRAQALGMENGRSGGRESRTPALGRGGIPEHGTGHQETLSRGCHGLSLVLFSFVFLVQSELNVREIVSWCVCRERGLKSSSPKC